MQVKLVQRTVVLILFGVGSLAAAVANAQSTHRETVEPIYRVTHRIMPEADVRPGSAAKEAEAISPGATSPAPDAHPLDRALEIAEEGLQHIRANVRDYQAILVKRERVNGRLLEPEYIAVKVRNRRYDERGRVPFSVYMRFLAPRSVRGQEAIYVEGWNDNRIAAHGTGITGFVRVNLDPNGSMAMRNNRYPIYEVGIENLVEKLLDKGRRDREVGPCRVRYVENTTINDRPCMMIEVVHEEQRQPYEFYRARIFIDHELQIPIRYSSYLWPEKPGEDPPLLEEYTYLNVELNVGLTSRDFDPDNPEYNYP